MSAQLNANKRDTVKDHRYMESDVTLYHNGKLVISTTSWSKKHNGGLKNHSVFVVCIDSNGNAIWASKTYKMTTIGGTLDVGTASEYKDVNEETAPPAIGENTSSIDIYHSAGDLSQNRASQVQDIKDSISTATAIANDVKNAIRDFLT